MSKRGSHRAGQNDKPLQKILEVSGQLEYTSTQPPKKNRVTVASIISGYQRQASKAERHGDARKVSGFEQRSLQQKDMMIKDMQEEIIDKKFRNDMIQEAFRKRQQASESKQDPECWTKLAETLVKGCVYVAQRQKNFRKSAFKSLMGALRAARKDRARGMKVLLVWMVGWITHLFSMLSGPLIKK